VIEAEKICRQYAPIIEVKPLASLDVGLVVTGSEVFSGRIRDGFGPVVGLPGCVMYHRASIFDLILPRLLAGESIQHSDIVKMGHGGFCASCKVCRFPSCSFGK